MHKFESIKAPIWKEEPLGTEQDPLAKYRAEQEAIASGKRPEILEIFAQIYQTDFSVSEESSDAASRKSASY